MRQPVGSPFFEASSPVLVGGPKLKRRECRKTKCKNHADCDQPKLIAKYRVNNREKSETDRDRNVPPR